VGVLCVGVHHPAKQRFGVGRRSWSTRESLLLVLMWWEEAHLPKLLISNSSHEGYCSTVGAFIFYVESELLYKNQLHNANTTLTISECNVFSSQCVEGPNITYGFNSIISIISIAVGVTVEIKNSTFQNTIIDIYTPLTQQDLTNNYNLPKVYLNDDRILNSVLFIALASFSISSSSESQSHFELAAISVIDTDVHLSGSLSFKKQFTHFGGNLPSCSSRAAVCHVCW